jgi:hypothetical protein
MPVAVPPEAHEQRIVVSAPMSFAGSAQRIWPMTYARSGWEQGAMTFLAMSLIALAWMVILAWYLSFGPLLIPYRLVRRSQRKRNRDAAESRNVLSVQAIG